MFTVMGGAVPHGHPKKFKIPFQLFAENFLQVFLKPRYGMHISQHSETAQGSGNFFVGM